MLRLTKVNPTFLRIALSRKYLYIPFRPFSTSEQNEPRWYQGVNSPKQKQTFEYFKNRDKILGKWKVEDARIKVEQGKDILKRILESLQSEESVKKLEELSQQPHELGNRNLLDKWTNMMLHIKALQKPIAKECGFDYDADLKEYHKFNHAIAKLGTVDEECRNLRLDIYFFAVEKVFGFKIDKEIKLPEGQAMAIALAAVHAARSRIPKEALDMSKYKDDSDFTMNVWYPLAYEEEIRILAEQSKVNKEEKLKTVEGWVTYRVLHHEVYYRVG